MINSINNLYGFIWYENTLINNFNIVSVHIYAIEYMWLMRLLYWESLTTTIVT